jgi:hypothetical protein
MKDLLIELAGGLAIFIAVFHQGLAEMRLFPAIKSDLVPSKPLLRGVWFNGSLAWIGIGILLFMSPTFASHSARDWIVLIAVLVLGSASIGNALYFRGKHPGWVLLAVTVGLALAGRQ